MNQPDMCLCVQSNDGGLRIVFYSGSVNDKFRVATGKPRLRIMSFTDRQKVESHIYPLGVGSGFVPCAQYAML